MPGPVAGMFFYLYLIVDIDRRKIVGWEVAMTAQRWQTAPRSMQMRVRKTRNAGQAKPAIGNPPDPSGSTPKTKSAPLKSETPHEIGGQHV